MTEQGERQAIVGSVVEGLKGSPALLWLIVLCALVFGLTAWSVQKQQDRTQELVERLMDRCLSEPVRRSTRWPIPSSLSISPTTTPNPTGRS